MECALCNCKQGRCFICITLRSEWNVSCETVKRPLFHLYNTEIWVEFEIVNKTVVSSV